MILRRENDKFNAGPKENATRIFARLRPRDANLHNAKRLISHQLAARVCFSLDGCTRYSRLRASANNLVEQRRV